MSPRAKNNTKQIRVFVTPEIYEKMQIEAEKKGMSISGVARMALNEKYFKTEEKEKKNG
jgi:hypothetical protein